MLPDLLDARRAPTFTPLRAHLSLVVEPLGMRLSSSDRRHRWSHFRADGAHRIQHCSRNCVFRVRFCVDSRGSSPAPVDGGAPRDAHDGPRGVALAPSPSRRITGQGRTPAVRQQLARSADAARIQRARDVRLCCAGAERPCLRPVSRRPAARLAARPFRPPKCKLQSSC